jgi:hypothetical protein
MRFIVLQSSVDKEGNLVLHGLTSLTHKPSGTIDGWIDLTEANTNCIDSSKCDLLSFENKEEVEENLEIWGIAGENVAIIGVEPKG